MSFWEDLSSATKGYLAIAAALIVLVVLYRSCSSGGGDDAPSPSKRGYQGPAQ
jgi:hypothetical protein